MKILEYLLLILCIGMIGISWAGTMKVTTGQGYFTYNGQPTAYYNFAPGNYTLDDKLSYVETNGTPTVKINQKAFTAYACSVNPNQQQCQ